MIVEIILLLALIAALVALIEHRRCVANARAEGWLEHYDESVDREARKAAARMRDTDGKFVGKEVEPT